MQRRAERILPWIFFALAGCFVAAAAVDFTRAREQAIVADVDVEITGCAPDDRREIVVRLTNRSNRPVRVLGMSTC